MNALKHKIKGWADQRFFNFVDKRVPPGSSHGLNRKNLYTFPTPMGFAYLLLGLLIWLLGTNYQNNLILSLSYLMLSLFVVVILHSYFNLAGLIIEFKSVEPCFSKEYLQFRFRVQCKSTVGCDGIILRWRKEENTTGKEAVVNSYDQTSILAEVPCVTSNRGEFSPKRLLVESTYPLGLIRCWSWLSFSAVGVVYPAPIECAWPEVAQGGGNTEEVALKISGDEFYGFRPYQPGDPLKSIGWKHYARGRGLVTQQFASSSSSAEVWLDWQDFSKAETEVALSNLCYWALKLDKSGVPFGLNLPGVQLVPNLGQAHLSAVLQSLALFGNMS